MSDTQIDGYASALFEVARAEGVLDRVRGRAVPLQPRGRRGTPSCAAR